jgi:hypothetical protein
MNHGTPGQLGAPGDKVKMFLWRPGRRQEVLDRNPRDPRVGHDHAGPPVLPMPAGPPGMRQPLTKAPTPHKRIMTRMAGSLKA